jgi:hypothetical protein
MTTTIKVISHNYPALVETFDRLWDAEANKVREVSEKTAEIIIWPKDGEQVFYCTTTRTIRVVDLEYDDPKATAAPAIHIPSTI